MPDILLENYMLVGRRDRENEARRGGVCLYARDAIAARVTLEKKSSTHEICWVMVHSEGGPILVGVMYRPPAEGEYASIRQLNKEFGEL